MKVLITGFDPFGGEPINPAWEAVKRLPDTILDATVIKAQIPTVFGKSATLLAELMHQHQPDVVINVGQAGGRFAITPERVAINLDDARIPDNEQQQPIDEVIQADGAPAYFSRLPIKGMV
ncbi:MAG: pyroglutamyl-peptidase I, partial [Aeromonas sobria]